MKRDHPEKFNILKCGIPEGEFHPCYKILESITEGIITIDLDKKITFFNKAAEKLTGFSINEALGQYCFDIVRANTCTEKCPVEKVAKTGEDANDFSAFIINKQGEQVPVSIRTCPLITENGTLLGVIEIFRDLSELERLRRQVSRTYSPEDIVGRHPRMRQIFAFLPDIAESDSPVLIEGPTGSGKELFARAIHNLSSRRNGPFIAINCGALPDTLLESELFGYTKGAFTGATRDKPGRFLLADKGTLFLDEICNTSLAFQADLLRVLEEGEFTPLGHTKSLKTDFRVVAATNRDLKQMVKEGTFREDLYYRLNVVKISLPPLRERKEDIPLLVEHFIHKFNLLKGRTVRGLSPEVMALFLAYPFPGNIREMENIIEYSYILCKGPTIEMEHLPSDLKEWAASHPTVQTPMGSLAKEEVARIQQALSKHKGNKVATAKELGISRTTLWRRIKKYGLD